MFLQQFSGRRTACRSAVMHRMAGAVHTLATGLQECGVDIRRLAVLARACAPPLLVGLCAAYFCSGTAIGQVSASVCNSASTHCEP